MGGLSNEQQEAALRKLPDIVVATPGLLLLFWTSYELILICRPYDWSFA